MSKYELIIFDCDGTLVDSENLIAFACSDVLKELGYDNYPPEKVTKMFHAQSITFTTHYFVTQYPSFPAARFEELCDQKVHEAYRVGLRAYSDTYTILDYCQKKGIKICVASNGTEGVVRDSLQKTDIAKYFKPEEVFTFDMIGVAKPEPDLFMYAADYFDVPYSKALVIEDSLVGVEAANRARMDVLMIDRSEQVRVPEGYKVLRKIKSMQEIEELV